jgi:hypothetical protein
VQGGRRSFPPSVHATAKAIACELPAKRDVGLSRWSAAEIARQLVIETVVETISASTVGRWLAKDAIKPWRHRSWIFPRDPHFAAKAARVLDLYARVFEGAVLADNEYVLSTDEKTSIQARCRCHPTLAPARRRLMAVEHEYERKGALAYLAAWDVHRGVLIGRTDTTTGIEPFRRLMTGIMAREPYRCAKRVFVIADNGSSHRGQRSVDRLAAQWPNVTLVHLPVHASWLNQIEIVFSIIQRKVLTPNDFSDTDAVAERLAAFEARFNETAQPFDWCFGRAELDKLLERLVPAA